MPEGHSSKKKGQARKPAKSELVLAREEIASYKGLIARIHSFHKLEGESDAERFNAIAKLYKDKEEERRNRKAAF